MRDFIDSLFFFCIFIITILTLLWFMFNTDLGRQWCYFKG